MAVTINDDPSYVLISFVVLSLYSYGKGPPIDVDWISIRQESVRSISNRRRSLSLYNLDYQLRIFYMAIFHGYTVIVSSWMCCIYIASIGAFTVTSAESLRWHTLAKYHQVKDVCDSPSYCFLKQSCLTCVTNIKQVMYHLGQTETGKSGSKMHEVFYTNHW